MPSSLFRRQVLEIHLLLQVLVIHLASHLHHHQAQAERARQLLQMTSFRRFTATTAEKLVLLEGGVTRTTSVSLSQTAILFQ